jgi:hypothetical protein
MADDYDWFMDPQLRRLSRQWMDLTEAATRATEGLAPGTGVSAEQRGLIEAAMAAEQDYFQLRNRLRDQAR